jgi:phosphoglucomutase
VTRLTYARARRPNTAQVYDYVGAYVRDLASVVDMDAISNSGLRIGVDPLGGAAGPIWLALADRYGVNVEVVNGTVDPTFRFMPLDWDGQIRMDCSSPYAMSNLIALRDRFDIAFGNDTDADHHGVVTRTAGLMNPNHYLAAAIAYLFAHRPGWRVDAGIGKTAVTSSLIDRVAAHLHRSVVEVPVGFGWFVPGLLAGSLGFGGEESAGASFLQRDGTAWTTDRDGIAMDLLAVEIMARTGADPAELYDHLTEALGIPHYERIEHPATPEQQTLLASFSPWVMGASKLAGDPIQEIRTFAAGNGAALGGVKVVSAHGWFAARPSATGGGYTLYAESFRGSAHLRRIQADAQAMLGRVFAGVAA